jgi:hypothetical protein
LLVLTISYVIVHDTFLCQILYSPQIQYKKIDRNFGLIFSSKKMYNYTIFIVFIL